ncbi:hypothetical protein BWZ20_01735 [Winogradskyella sp. J14-2]|uniref:GyrI-like domain-containing protein n=1 Tax=Winogradskyella sp. J14-2 TaxID=1936080 RepID=UPI000972C521|nr:GyrI-like domain-containing protein [Winogradskyella sp. J14-2]APY07100.1 hypothetical protein BWZ20_01735 [Winogradskyella sp. J14-2]
MKPTIIDIKQKIVIGQKSKMLQHQSKNIVALWKQFMPRKHHIKNTISLELMALQDYSAFGNFEVPFDIWACVEVSKTIDIPNKMEIFTIPAGKYAKFLHKGNDAGATYQKIMEQWLPNSNYSIDSRPHFQVMGQKYIHGSPDSEEDFYVPIIKT